MNDYIKEYERYKYDGVYIIITICFIIGYPIYLLIISNADPSYKISNIDNNVNLEFTRPENYDEIKWKKTNCNISIPKYAENYNEIRSEYPECIVDENWNKVAFLLSCGTKNSDWSYYNENTEFCIVDGQVDFRDIFTNKITNNITYIFPKTKKEEWEKDIERRYSNRNNDNWIYYDSNTKYRHVNIEGQRFLQIRTEY